MSKFERRDFPIPERTNLVLLGIASIASGSLLYLASHVNSVPAIISCAFAFSLTANTLFSLLHEAVHGLFSKRRRVNEWAGRFAAAWFPTGLTVQRAFHLTHHKNNRSHVEQFDVIHDGDIKWLKYAQWYSIFTGIYWAISVVGLLVYLLIPRVLRLRMLREEDSKVAEQTSSHAYFSALEGLDAAHAKFEIALSLIFQCLLIWLLDLSIAGWLACYAAFALSWSSLQYTDHAFSSIDASNGAWNLRVGPIGRIFFLNYHCHLAHHQYPGTPWVHLPSLVDSRFPQPYFFRVLLESWRGPRKINDFPRMVSDCQPSKRILGIPRGIDSWVAAGLSFALLIIFIFFFGGANWLAGMIPWRFEVALPFETSIPFWPEAAFVYLSLNVLICMAPFVLRSWRELFPLFASLAAETIVASFFFLLFPVRTTFPERNSGGIVGAFFDFANTINLDQNFVPSLHVAFAFTVAFALSPKLGRIGRAGIYLWATAISASTILIHEHHVLDVVTGFISAVFFWTTVGSRFKRSDILAAINIELLCCRDFLLFGKRHVRYWLIAFLLILGSLPKWRERRVLRTGFCFLQHVDDLLDGDRKSLREPLDVIDEITLAIETNKFGNDDLMLLAKAFALDIRNIGGDAAVDKAMKLIAVMRKDRCRVLDQQLLSKSELRAHHRETFSLSIDLMLIARDSDLRAKDVPELVHLLGWCSTLRDFREDLAAGLINIPVEVINAAGLDNINKLSYEALLSTPAVQSWIRMERLSANRLLEVADRRLEALKGQRGEATLRIFAKSIRKFSQKKFNRLFPMLA